MKNQPICYIFAAGEYYEQLPIQPNAQDLVIAVDGGYLYTKQHEIDADLIIGDFDSLSEIPKDKANIIILPQEKDDTDMLAALREAWQKGFRIFHIYGGTGGRIDHTLANVQCLAALAKHGGRGYLFGQDVIITAIHNDCIAFSAIPEGIVSVFSHSEIASGVFEKGLKYSLENATLKNTYPIGISNEFKGVSSSISVQSGTLIIVYPKDTKEI